MDGIITILIFIALFGLRSAGKKKQAQGKRIPRSRGEASAETAPLKMQAKLPFSRAEWEELLKNDPPQAQPNSTKMEKKAAGRAVSRKDSEAAAPMRQAAVPPPEGMVSTQGESAQEHDAHMARIRAEEERSRQAQQSLQELRALNRQKLRSAVIMSEVLGKPVSLRSCRRDPSGQR